MKYIGRISKIKENFYINLIPLILGVFKEYGTTFKNTKMITFKIGGSYIKISKYFTSNQTRRFLTEMFNIIVI